MKKKDDPDILFKDVMHEYMNIQNKNKSCIDFIEINQTINSDDSANKRLLASTLKKRRLAAEGNDKKTKEHYLSEFAVEAVDAYDNVEFNLCFLKNKEKNRLRYSNTSYTIDLHGFRIEEARNEISISIQEAVKNKVKYITIIHGSSTSSKNQKNTIKSFCVHWLKQMPEVVAFCSSMTKYNNISKVNFGSINVLLL